MFRRFRMLVVVALLVFPSPLVAQQPQAKPPAALPPRIAQLLTAWAAQALTTDSLIVGIKQTTVNPAFPKAGREKIGVVKFMKLKDGNFGALLELHDPDSEDFDKFVCTGTHLYQFRPQTREINEIALAARQQGQAMDDGPLPFLFGMKAETATKRYQLDVRPAEHPDWHTIVSVTPNFDRDQKEFTRAELVILNKDTAQVAKDMPVQISWIEPTKNRVIWEITQFQRNPKSGIDAREFAKPTLPPGWRLTHSDTTAR